MPSLPLRFTVDPDEDVDLASGLRFADVRAPLAQALGREDLARRTLFVGSKPLDDDALSGHPPLLSGVVVTTAPQPDHILDRAHQAKGAPWQLRVTNGVDAGWVLGLHPGKSIVVTGAAHNTPPGRRRFGSRQVNSGRVNSGRVRAGRTSKTEHLYLADDGLHEQEFLVRATKRGVRVRLRWLPRTLFNRKGRQQIRGLRRPVRRWRKWAPGVALYAGGTVFDVSHTADPTPPATGILAGGRPPESAPTGAGKPRSRGALMFLLPAAGSIVMAVTMRQPLFALMALAGPLMLVMSMVGRRKSRSAGAKSNGTGGRTPRLGNQQDPEDYCGPVSLISTPHRVADRALPPGLPRAAALHGEPGAAQARALVCWLAAAGFRVVLLGSTRALRPWQAARWLTGAQAFDPADVAGAFRTPADAEVDARTVIVAVQPRADTWLSDLSAAWSKNTSRIQLLLVEDEVAPLPAWVTPATPDGGISASTFEVCCRDRAAAESHQEANLENNRDDDATSATQATLPATVALVTQLHAPQRLGTPSSGTTVSHWVQNRWATAPPGLRAVLGQGTGGQPITIDLPVDGPHALVAGTTGAGKSEFLQTLICSLALTYSPADLVFALIDYKGGTSFGVCADLPHVVGLVTDLEPGLAQRALTGLQSELHRRERLMATAGVANLDAYRATAGSNSQSLPRLMIVVDEFRALADDLPDFLPGLLRIAAQGRSLGIHLVLATQRPGGAVNADMRANIGLRVCLRVTDATDSRDVIDSAAAAKLPASAPGRTVMVTTTQPEQTFQAAYAPAPHPDSSALVRRAANSFTAPRFKGPSRDSKMNFGNSHTADSLTALVAGACTATLASDISRPQLVWLPGLADDLEVPAHDAVELSHVDPAVLPLLLLDVPAQQTRRWDGWDLRGGHLAIEGSASSGRTTALYTLAHAALDRGYHVHVIGRAEAFSPLLSHPGVGTVVDQEDPRRVAALLQELTQMAPTPATAGPTSRSRGTAQLVLIDDVEEVLTALSALARGSGGDVLTAALRMPRSRDVSFALTTARPLPGALTSLIGPRVVLVSNTKQDDVARGVPGPLAGLGTTAGRAVWFSTTEPLIGQIGRCPLDEPPRVSASDDHTASEPLRIAAVPDLVPQTSVLSAPGGTWPGITSADRAEVHRAHPDKLPVGLGGHGATPVQLDVSRGALIAGPHGSGRSNVLALLHQQLDPARCLVIARDGPLLDLPAGLRVSEFSGASLVEALNTLHEELRAASTPGAPPPSAQPWTILLDDAESLFQTCPLEADHLTRDRRPGRLIATSTTAGAASAMRGPLTDLRSTRTGIVLAPGTPGSADIFGTPLTWLIEPGLCPAGRGVLVHGRDLQLVQVASVH